MHNNCTLIKLLRSISLTFVVCFGLMSIIATGGGDGGGGGGSADKGTPPEISNLFIDEICTIWSGIQVTGSVDFIDDDGNVSRLHIEVFPSGGGEGEISSGSIVGFSGETSGTIYFDAPVGDLPAGDYTFELYVTDTRGLESNILTEEFIVEANEKE